MAVGEQGDQQAIDELFLTEDLAGEKVAKSEQRVSVFHGAVQMRIASDEPRSSGSPMIIEGRGVSHAGLPDL
ncbi:hypothetical protein Pstr01_24820 [Pseudomonas straminea]|nr:hypothetical protein Pstr01_24820 [Pseudomonas straminea]